MSFRVFSGTRSLILLGTFLLLIGGSWLMAASSSGVLRGQVVDPSGAGIPGATVSVSGAGGYRAAAMTNGSGEYQIKGLAPGAYTIQASAPSFSTFTRANVNILAGRAHQLNISLEIKQQVQQVKVSAQATHLSVNPENNANALVLKGSALQSLSDDPDELLAQLEAMAGPAAGPNGAQIYIDGFTGGQLPPKSDILEVHINQNPFSAEYDKVGYGRIEIITKPGSSQYHGEVFVDGNDSPFNSRSPFVTEEPPYYSDFIMGNVGGPLGHKASFFFDVFHRDINANSVVSAVTLNPNFVQTPFSEALPNPESRWVISPRLDFQVTPKNLLAVRYQLWRDGETNDGIGQFDLPSQAYNSREQEQTLQLSDTQVLSSRTVNQTRFEYRYDTSNQMPTSLEPALDVLGAFTGGGNPQGTILGNENYFELQDIATMSLGKHTVMYGGRIRNDNEAYSSTENFNGTFTFPTLDAYQIMEEGLQQNLPFSQIQAEGGGPSQFFITTGHPSAHANMVDGAVYAEDQWRMRQNLSLSLGLRFETQNYINDHADFAPRLGFAWGIGRRHPPKTVLRAGFGIFYDRFQEQQVLEAEQLNGINQSQFVVTNPAFFFSTIPSASTLSTLTGGAVAPTVDNIDPSLRAPYTIQTAIGLERKVSKSLTASVTYLNSHGLHQLYTRNINTPNLGLYNPSDPTFGRPFGHVSACSVVPAIPDCEAGFEGNIYQFESDGLYNQNELIANFQFNRGALLSFFGYYMLNYANSDTSGVTYFPSNPYDVLEDYGRATFDVRDRAVVGGAINLPFGFRLLPFVIADSGTPYNVTLGQDLLGTSIFDQRPAFAPAGAKGPNIVTTSLGVFNTAPTLGEPLVPVNYGTGPAEYAVNLHFYKTFRFGGKEERGHGGGGGGHHHNHGLGGRGLSSGGHGNLWAVPGNSKYSLTLGVAVHNSLNTVNLGTPDGNLGSPLFGKSNSLANGPFSTQSANRRLDFQIRFTF
jgi:hypothetical protein